MPKYPHHEFFPVDPHSVEEARAAQLEERRKAIEAVPSLAPHLKDDPLPAYRVNVTPIGPNVLERAKQDRCNAAVDCAVERFGRQAVMHSLRLVLAANGIEIAGKTWDELSK